MPLLDLLPDTFLNLLGLSAPAPAPADPTPPPPAMSGQEGAFPLASPEGDDFSAAVYEEEMTAFAKKAADDPMPVLGGGRSSVPENGFSLLPDYFSNVATDFPFPLVQVLENLSIFNRHVSHAVDNVVTLAATEMTIEFSDNVKEKEAQRMREHLRRVQYHWYEFTDGHASLVLDLFAQVATYGALSAEIVPRKDLKGVKSVPKVNPTKIRFMYDRRDDANKPTQQVPINTPGARGGFKELNQNTYKYIALRKYKNTPYGVPPFIAAIEDIYTENDMLGNFKSMMRRLGMLGFLSVMVKKPDLKDGESEVAYRTRLRNHLENDIRPQVEQGFNRGVTIGFEGAHTFELQGSQMNAMGADSLLRIVRSLVYQGLHQDPNMHGDNQSSTESFTRVILTKLIAQVAGYQRVVAAFFEQLYLMELYLAGFRPGYVLCTFRPAIIGDQKREEETEGLRIANVLRKRDEGIISQQTAAAELGYDKPDQKVAPPRPATGPAPAPNLADNKDGTESKGAGNPRADKQGNGFKNPVRPRLQQLSAALGGDGPAFDYSVPAACEPAASFAEAGADYHDERLSRHLRRYGAAVGRRFTKALTRTREPLRRAIYKLPKEASQQDLQDVVLYSLVRNWQKDFVAPVASLAKVNLSTAYIDFRQDKRCFTQARGFGRSTSFFTVPDAVLGLLDYRAIDYLAAHDTLYLGKFIVDPDTRQRIISWVASKYLGENSPIGKGQAAVTQFLDEYQAQVQLEEYKIRRVLETTVNRARNYANLNYINQAELEEFEVVEVNDRLTCGYCSHMHGQIFSVATTLDKVNTVVSSPPADTPTLAPFATTIPLAEFKTLSADQLQERGINTPSYHCHCRGRLVAVI